MYWEWLLQVFFVPFPQGSGIFPYVFLITIHLSTLVTVEDITFAVLGVLILMSDQQLLDGGTSLEVCLYPISAADLLEAFSQSLYIGYHYVACIWFVLVGAYFCACRIVGSLFESSWLLLLLPFSSQLLLVYLFCVLFMAHLGDLHFARASLRCYNSSLRSSGAVHTVLALWVNLPMTLYLTARL